MSTKKRVNNWLRRGLVCLLPVVCALLLLCNTIPALMETLKADHYAASGESPEILPITFSAADGLININTASLAELDTLPGIGPAIAQAIIDEREAAGPYFYPEDLMDAKGVGESKFAAVSELITIGE